MSDGFIQTKSSRLRNGGAKDFKEVVFVSHQSKSKDPSTSQQTKSSKMKSVGEEGEEIDMKKARSEIVRFAMSGMVGQEKRLSKEALAISLGALPAKRKKVNYKLLKEQRQKQKELLKSSDAETFSSSSHQTALLSSKVLSRKALSKGKSAKSRKQSDILGVYGKVKKSEIKM